MDMKKEEMLYKSRAGGGRSSVVQDADMTVSEAEAEIDKILSAEAAAVITDTEIQKDKLLVHGKIYYNVLCRNTEGDVTRLFKEQAFSEAVDVKDCDEEKTAIANAKIVKTDARLASERRVCAKVCADIEVSIYETKQSELITELSTEGVEQKRQTVSFMQNCGMHQKRFEIQEQIEIAGENPPAYEILRVDGKISSDGYRVVNGKVVVKADLNAVILYVDSENYQLCTASLSIPFTEIFEVDGIEEDWLFLQNLAVENILFEAQPDARGEMRVLNLNCFANATAKMYKPVTVTMLSDCYGVLKQVEMVTDSIPVYMHTGDMNSQVGIKGQIEIGDMPKVGQVYHLCAEPRVDSTTIEDGKCHVRGNAKIKVYYITEDSETPLAVLEKDIPFSESFSCKADQATPVFFLQASGISYTLNGDYVIDIRGNLVFSGVLLREDAVQAVRAISVEEMESEKDLPSVTVCFAKDGEGLWEVAKRYSTSVKAIMEVNGVTEGTNLSGKRLIVPKYR